MFDFESTVEPKSYPEDEENLAYRDENEDEDEDLDDDADIDLDDDWSEDDDLDEGNDEEEDDFVLDIDKDDSDY